MTQMRIKLIDSRREIQKYILDTTKLRRLPLENVAETIA